MSKDKRDFDKEASSWDTPLRVVLAQDIVKAILSVIPLTLKMDVLDLGCGTGLVTMGLAPLVHSVTSVDSSEGMLDVLRAKVQKGHIRNVRVHALDLAQDGALGGAYHLIVSSMTLHHVRDTRRLVAQLQRALVPGGVIALADLDEEGGIFHDNNDGVFHFGFDRERLKDLFREEGFVDLRDTTASVIRKPAPDGGLRDFPVFLLTARKS